MCLAAALLSSWECHQQGSGSQLRAAAEHAQRDAFTMAYNVRTHIATRQQQSKRCAAVLAAERAAERAAAGAAAAVVKRTRSHPGGEAAVVNALEAAERRCAQRPAGAARCARVLSMLSFCNNACTQSGLHEQQCEPALS